MFGLQLEPVEKQLLPYKGLPVCLLMKDGSRKIGQLTACGSGRLILNGGTVDSSDATILRKTAARRAGRRRTRKQQDSPEPRQPQTEAEWDDLSFAPFGLEPMFTSMPKENVLLKTVDSVLVL
jgi:hypothetical protein